MSESVSAKRNQQELTLCYAHLHPCCHSCQVRRRMANKGSRSPASLSSGSAVTENGFNTFIQTHLNTSGFMNIKAERHHTQAGAVWILRSHTCRRKWSHFSRSISRPSFFFFLSFFFWPACVLAGCRHINQRRRTSPFTSEAL